MTFYWFEILPPGGANAQSGKFMMADDSLTPPTCHLLPRGYYGYNIIDAIMNL